MQCPQCGADNTDDRRSCRTCDTPLTVRCPRCSAESPVGKRFCADCGSALAAPVARRLPTIQATTGGRRQLTVMFCDLVGSTELAARVDPEDLLDIISEYQRRVIEMVGAFGGFCARFIGDGALIYFGYPEAHEDDPERAVRAGLAVVDVLSRLQLRDNYTPQVRIGIATGVVVVADFAGAGEAHAAAGETPNLAARIQAEARPNAILIADSTRRLLGALFEVRDLGPVHFKGFADAVPVYEVLRPGRVQGRFGALHAPQLTPLVGRSAELEELDLLWRRALSGAGETVLLSGEAGIGKSRLITALEQRIAATDHASLRYFCSSYHTNSTLYPVAQFVGHAAGLESDDAPQQVREKLGRLMPRASVEELDLIASTIGSFRQPEADRQAGSSRRRREMTLQAMLAEIERIAARKPVFVLVEDLHWADPTTLELIDMLVDLTPRLPLLFVATLRPEIDLDWTGRPNVTHLTLNRLGREQSAALIGHVAGATSLPGDVIDFIVQRTDGVPLYAEEMTKALLEADVGEDEAGRPLLAQGVSAAGIPTSLQASLMARLDRLGPARDLAQAGAVIGRVFDHDLLAMITDLPDTQLRQNLQRLTDAGLVLAENEPGRATYRFKHALVRDAAYATLLREQRRQLHERIGTALEAHFPGVAVAQPDLLARHFTEAGAAEKAVRYWAAAGRQAMDRFAMAEAAAHLQEALAALRRLPESTARHRHELDLLIALGHALISARGYSALGTGQVFEKARMLSGELGDTSNLIRVVHGQWAFHLMRAEMAEANRVATDLMRRAEASGTIDLELNAHRLSGSTLFQIGHIAAGCRQLEHARDLLAAHRSEVGRIVQGNDALVGVPAYLCVAQALLGLYPAARATSQTALHEARRSGRPHRLAFALGVAGCWFHGMLDEDAPALHEEWAEVAEAQEFPFWTAYEETFRGLRMIKVGQVSPGLVLLRQGSARLRGLGAVWGLPFFLGSAGLVIGGADGLAMVQEATALVESTGVLWFSSELLRIRGELFRADGHDDQAEGHFRRAIADARQQGNLHWQLRSALSLARLRPETIPGELAPVYRKFAHPDATEDLREAGAMLRSGATPAHTTSWSA